jgi:hypothetical protein
VQNEDAVCDNEGFFLVVGDVDGGDIRLT